MPNNQIQSLTISGTTYDIVDNTSGYITADSPALTGTPTAPTPLSGADDTQIATVKYVQDSMAGAGAGTVTSVGVANATDGGLSVSGSPITSSGTISVGHSNVLASAQTTSGIYPIKIDKNGHISEYGSAVSIPTKTSDLTNDSGFLTSAPVTSVNGQTGAVTVTEGLAPLIGTTSTVTAQQVMTALDEGRDICISATSSIAGVPLELKFTSFNRATDTEYSGQAIDVVVSQTIAVYGSSYYLFELVGGISNGYSMAWTVYNTTLAQTSDIPESTSDLLNDSDFVSDANYVHTDNNYTSAEKSKLAGIASGAEVNVQSDWNETNSSADDFIKNKPSIPSKTSDLTNDSNFTSFSAIVSSTQPTTQSTGDLWFKIVS